MSTFWQKIIEYQMEDESTNPKYASTVRWFYTNLLLRVAIFLVFFFDKHPEYTIPKDWLTYIVERHLNGYSHHPFQFTKNLKRDLYDTVNIPSLAVA
jgi:hypothetical protein